MAPPFRADHVGSLLRPPELLRARAEHQAGRLSAEELRRVEDGTIADAVQMQQEIGLEQLCLSPQCGFSSTVDGNALTIEEEKAKLRLVVETAREVWG